jgi:hypothetical protein
LLIFYASVEPFNRFAGGDDAAFAPATQPGSGVVDPAAKASATAAPANAESAPQSTLPTTAPAVATSTRLAIVGDSQANALAVNLPDGIDTAFADVVNGSVDGCSVYDSGTALSVVTFQNDFSVCDGWQDDWASSADGADVTLVVLGAWDVFDIEDGSKVYGFDTPQADQHFAANLMTGIDTVLAEGTRVALLEVGCMRPVDVDGAGVRALPERGDDERVGHVNSLLRYVASLYGTEVRFVDGPREWCDDESIATDLGYRWDGVHVYEPGATLIYNTIAPELLELAAP